MTGLIDNTLFIISKATKSRATLLLKINNLEDRLISFIGENPDKLKNFRNTLFHLHNSSGIDNESVRNLPSFKSISSDLGVSSCYVKPIFSVNERNETVYLILFTDEIDKYDQITKDILLSFANILSNQLKEADEEQSGKRYDFLVSEETVDEKLITENWKENFYNVWNLSDDIIFLLDNDGCFLKINSSGALLLNYHPEEMKGKHFLEFVSDENKADVSAAFTRLIHSAEPITFKADLKSRIDKIISLEFNGKTIVKGNKIIGMFGIGKDISQLKIFEEEINRLKPKLTEAQRIVEIERSRVQNQKSIVEELNRLKSEFVSNISHEFRTPLASIIGFSETIVSDPDLPDEMKNEFNNVILNEGKRLAKLINDILDLSKIEGHKITIIKRNFDVVQMLKKVIFKNKAAAGEKGVVLNFERPYDEIFIDGDKEKLAQVFDALINNAIKFTNEQGRVKIIVNNLFKEVEIVVSDTGIGIPEKDLPYIFQKFYRVSRPGTEIPGTGIGLVFVKQIIDLHKGLVSVQSELGNGTTFIIKLLKSIRVNKNEVET
ncbi:alkaline phosphatase synthesis sensor protein PhoR [bacterium BMS3Abin03]|nr:alkaline phosphatase synthesis sensor protein PhoR [bacterium BMS3Abin03]